ncbi:hypothetical protein [Vibrio coralliilyticus]|uniref:Uncharacterized protein n=1 Tax=Vibrio coralliilyticus TaxID=190893 RepID=A0AAP6ZVK5_9VIBR|nr:hypothetical protein [Vibrio coralliilyticus]NOJ25473.1 hypothetical protein [Vibrio coralliilyticus]
MKATYQMLRKAMRTRGPAASYWRVHQVMQGLELSDPDKRILLAKTSMAMRNPKRTSYYLDLKQRLADFKATGVRISCLHPAKVSGVRRPLPR